MNDSDLINALDECITLLNAGYSLEECLRRHPQHAARLRPLLISGLVIRQKQATPLLVMAARERVRTRIRHTPIHATRMRPRWRGYPQLAMVAGFLLVLGLVLSSRMVSQWPATQEITLTPLPGSSSPIPSSTPAPTNTVSVTPSPTVTITASPTPSPSPGTTATASPTNTAAGP